MWAALQCILSTVVDLGTASGQEVDQRLWGVDPGVTLTAAAVTGNTLYVGGNFVSAAPVVGGGAITDAWTGALRSNSPRVAGSVYACIPDGRGGWYLGGLFKGIGGIPRTNLAHVYASGRVDAWAPNPDGAVAAIALSGNTLYVGGDFATIGGQHRDFVAAVDISTGNVTRWSPGVMYGDVLALLVCGNTIYLGGQFLYVDGAYRPNLASVDAIEGRVTTWSPAPNPTGYVYAMAMHSDTLFAGGRFVEMGGVPRQNLAAFDARTGQLAAWDAHMSRVPEYRFDGGPRVGALLISGERLFVGGSFNHVGSALRPALVELNVSNGEATDWDPRVALVTPESIPATFSLALRGRSLYVAGLYDSLGGRSATLDGAIDTETGERLAWEPSPNLYVSVVGVSADAVYVGGVFTSVGPQIPRHGLAAFDLQTGAVTPWDPYPDGQTFAIAPHSGVVYVGGSFSSFGGTAGQVRHGIAAIDSASGKPTAWNPQCSGSVWCISFGDSTVYAGGSFDEIGSQPRNHLAELDLKSGLATAWNPNPNDAVTSVVASTDVVYAGGRFTAMGGGSHGFVAALDPVTGLATPWDPRADRAVDCVAVDDTTVYLGGFITQLGGQPRAGFGAISARSGAVLPLTADLDGEAKQIVVRNGVVYVGGAFTTISGLPRHCLAAVEPISGRILDWNPDADGTVWAMTANDRRLYPVGAFARMGTSAVSLMASVSLATGGSAPAPPQGASVLLALDVTSPCRSSGIVHFALGSDVAVNLQVFDMQGRKVASLLDRSPQAAGEHELTVATSGWPPGFYFYRLQGGPNTATRKMVVLP